jgi:hypothetical protein
MRDCVIMREGEVNDQFTILNNKLVLVQMVRILPLQLGFPGEPF